MRRRADDSNEPRYLNRERSWLRFNERVLELAEDEATPLLERLLFLSIFESNLDEFYMVRVSGWMEQRDGGGLQLTVDGYTPQEQLDLIREHALPLRVRAASALESLWPLLAEEGIRLRRVEELDDAQRAWLSDKFQRDAFPVCTPLILHPSPSPPFISNRSLNLAVVIGDKKAPKLARVKVPSVLPRFIGLPGGRDFVTSEDLLAHHLETLFPGVQLRETHLFRVVRDADIEIRETDAADLVTTIEETIRARRFGAAVLLEVAPKMPKEVRRTLRAILDLDEEDVFEVPGMLGMEGLSDLASLPKPKLRYARHTPVLSERLREGNLFATIAKGDVLVHHPFDGFASVEGFVRAAANDPAVIGIKQTLYRVGAESPIVDALLQAAEAGKQVAAMVELKARFDESNNLVWARKLERAGVHVTYGFAEMKTHAKMCLVVRREPKGIRSYAHAGTGNYNPSTARVYTDLGLFTCDKEITQDVAELFNLLTGFSKQDSFRALVVAPLNLREGIIERIEREAKHFQATGKGHIVFKVNSLVDPEVIDALYEASAVGVPIDLIVRGICCLRPGVEGLSKTIRVRSILGRFLEHSRVYWFENGGTPDVLIGSADLMPRNLDRRIETLVPVRAKKLVSHLRTVVLEAYLHDQTNAWTLDADGLYKRSRKKNSISAQKSLAEPPTAGSVVA